MDTNLFLSANCFVPITEVDMALATTSIKRMPFLHSINRFCESDELKHTPEDEDHIWISGIFKVPDHQLGVMLRVLSGLPYFQTLTMPEKEEVRDQKMQLRYHPRFSSSHRTASKNGKGKDREVDEQAAEGTSFEMSDAEEAANGQTQQTAVEGPAQEAAVEVIEIREDSSDEMDVTAEHIVPAPPAPGDRPRTLIDPEAPRRLSTPELAALLKAVPAPPPPGVPTTFLSHISGPWKCFLGRGEASPVPPLWPFEAYFTPLSSISMYSDRQTTNAFYTNVVGKVDPITELFWRLELVDPNNAAYRVCAFMFPLPDTNFELGAALPGLTVGDVLMIFNVQVPEECNYVSVKDDSVVFRSLRPDRCGVYSRRAKRLETMLFDS